jgi:hypothetical protein
MGFANIPDELVVPMVFKPKPFAREMQQHPSVIEEPNLAAQLLYENWSSIAIGKSEGSVEHGNAAIVCEGIAGDAD